MRRNSNSLTTGTRSFTLLALAASLAIAPLLGGCDNTTGKADKKVLTGVQKVTPAVTVADGMKNIAALDELSKEADASPARKALTKSALAGAELQTGKQMIADLQAQELKIARKIWEMEQVAGQMQQTRVLIDAATRRNPAEALPAPIMGEKTITEDLKNKAAAAREGEVWVKSDTVPMQTVSAVKQIISSLSGKISDIKSNIETLNKQRTQLTTDAAKSQQDSEGTKGDESQKAFIKAADLRKQAAMVSVQIEAAQSSLVPLEADLAAAQAHEKIVTDAAAAFDASAQTYTENYAKIKEQADKMSASVKSMLGGDKDSLKSKAIELNTMMADADALRGKALEQVKAAVSHYGDAVNESEKVKTENKKDVSSIAPADAALIKQMTEASDASSMRLRQAEATATLAEVEAAHALLLSRKLTVMSTATGAATPMALQVPSELVDPKLPQELKDVQTAAEDAYTKADGEFENVSQGSGGPRIQKAALLARAVLNAGWSQFSNAAGDASKGKAHMSDAIGYQKTFGEEPDALVVPRYLMLLTDTVPTPTISAPATQPAKVEPPVETPTPGGPVLMPPQ